MAIELKPSPVATIELVRNDDGIETGRRITPAPEIEISYSRASADGERLLEEGWMATGGTATAAYSYAADQLTRIEESGFDEFGFWYAFDRDLPMGFAPPDPTWTVEVDYDASGREAGRRWLTTDVFWSSANTYGACAD